MMGELMGVARQLDCVWSAPPSVKIQTIGKLYLTALDGRSAKLVRHSAIEVPLPKALDIDSAYKKALALFFFAGYVFEASDPQQKVLANK